MKEKDARRQVIARAIVDPEFRARLQRDPESVLGKLTAEDRVGLGRAMKFFPALDEMVGHLAGEVLCGGGGGCPGLA